MYTYVHRQIHFNLRRTKKKSRKKCVLIPRLCCSTSKTNQSTSWNLMDRWSLGGDLSFSCGRKCLEESEIHVLFGFLEGSCIFIPSRFIPLQDLLNKRELRRLFYFNCSLLSRDIMRNIFHDILFGKTRWKIPSMKLSKIQHPKIKYSLRITEKNGTNDLITEFYESSWWMRRWKLKIVLTKMKFITK